MFHKPLSILSHIGGSHAAHLISTDDLKLLAEEISQNGGLMITAQHIKGRNHDLIEVKVMFHPNVDKPE